MLPSVVGAKAGKKGGSGGAASRIGGRQRLGLIVFGAVFVLLFAIFAIAQGIGQPSVPAGDVAIVKSVPSELGTISEADYRNAFARQSKGKAPKPGEAKYAEVQKAALGELLEAVWVQGEGEELGIAVTPTQIARELKTIKEQNFKTNAAYQEFLKESHFTPKEINERVKIQILTTKIRERVAAEAPAPSESQIKSYYEAEKSTQFTTPASRDIRVVFNKDKAKAEKAKEALEKDHSPAGWKKVAAKYSSDPTTKSKGGLQEGITEEFVRGPLKQAIFGGGTGELVGPVAYEGNNVVLEVVKLNPAKTKSLGEVKSQISQTLTQEMQQESFTAFINGYQTKWRSRSYCAAGYTTEQCANYKGTGHPTNANPACYEANPKTPATECPAVVTPTSPALPGSVSVTKPKGEPFPQRPLPESPGPAAGAEGLEALPPTGG